MPNLQNAKKALRVSDRKRVLNDKRRKAIKETAKTAKSVVGSDKKVVIETLSKAYQAIDKAAKRGIIKKNTANRRKARLAKSLKPTK
jgi:small subunit ribosomal protein S20